MEHGSEGKFVCGDVDSGSVVGSDDGEQVPIVTCRRNATCFRVRVRINCVGVNGLR
jgi:hypothetical protein